MTTEELDEWVDDFEAFRARFAGLFARREPREQAAKYMRGLMGSVERKNGWQIAEAIGDKTPDPTQRLLYKAKWDADKARDELQQFVNETLGDEDGIGIVDETGFLKKGTKSVGVKRQYTGRRARWRIVRLASSWPTLPRKVKPSWTGGSTCPGNGATMRNGALRRRCPKRLSFRPSRNKR